jgi:hypothetical protein
MRRRDTFRLSSSRAPRGRAERDLLEQSAVLLSLMSALQHITDLSQTSRHVRNPSQYPKSHYLKYGNDALVALVIWFRSKSPHSPRANHN